MQTNGTIVVGANRTPASRAALEYALLDAGRRNARLRVVSPEASEADRRGIVKSEVDVADNAQMAAVPITVDAGAGAPGRVLVEAADGADLLLLGHRGRGAVRSALLGSVGLHCVLHAPCPVTVVGSAASDEPVVAGAATV
jgi:nucleotide-binding universal stress UspA family protein